MLKNNIQNHFGDVNPSLYPLVTVILLCYKQENYVKDAVISILNQDYLNIQFILSDDCSPDSTFNVIKKEVKPYQNSKNIILNQNEANMGLVAHFNKLMKMAEGEIIVVAAGDDISLIDRISNTVEILKNKEISFVSFNDEIIDSNGDCISRGQRVTFDGLKTYDLMDYFSGREIPFSGASRGFRKEIYDYFGDLHCDCPTEDTPYILRGLLLGKAAISSKIGIKYRVHEFNLSGVNLLHKMKIEEISKQYHLDIAVAFKNKIISLNVKNKFIKWDEKNNKRRKLQNELNANSLNIKFVFLNILAASCFTFKEKLYYLKKSIFN